MNPNKLVTPSPKITAQGCDFLKPFEHTGNILINIRGTNGSGKTYTTRKIVDQFPIVNRFKTEEGITVYDHGNFYLIGSYDNDCGGLDTVRDFYQVAPLAIELLKTKSVLMEGLLWSSVFSAMHKLEVQAREHGHLSIWCTFDDLIETMIGRVVERRARNGKFTPFPIQNLLSKIAPICSGINHAILFGSKVIIGKSEDLQEKITHILKTKSVEGVEFYTDHFEIEDLQKWKAIIKNDKDYTVLPDEELVRDNQTSHCILDL